MKRYIRNAQLNSFKRSLKKTRLLLGRRDSSDMNNSFGVEGNTFRAFRGWNTSPSKVYRIWANDITNQIIQTQPTKEIMTETEFIMWHKSLYKSLYRHWNKEQGAKLSLAHGYKLVGLYIKWLSLFKFQDKYFVVNINKHAFCALDRQTLTKIKLCYGNCMPINNPSMGDILNQNTYDFCQSIIKEFCITTNGTKLEFDDWAWRKGG